MEAPNQIKFHTPFPSATASSIKQGGDFSSIFKSIEQQSSPPEPKKNTPFVLIDAHTSIGLAKQQLSQLSQPGVLKFQYVSADSKSFSPILSSATHHPHLQHLVIRHSNMGAQHHIDAVSQVLKLNDGIAWLVLDHNQIKNNGVKKILSNLHPNNQITHLVLSHNHISDEGLTDIINALPKMPHLQTLWLSNNQITNHQLNELLSATSKHPSLTTIDLQNNSLGITPDQTQKMKLSNIKWLV